MRRDKIFHKNHKKKADYKRKKYKNPFFQVKNRKPKISYISLRLKLIIIGVIALIAAIVWLCFFSAYFRIKSIIINGSERISSKELEDLVWAQSDKKKFLAIPQKNIFVFNADSLYSDLNEKYGFEQLAVSKKLPDKIIISIEEKKYSAVWHEKSNDKYYFIDDSGGLINETSPLELKDKTYPIIEHDGGDIIENKAIKGQTDNIKYILNLNNELKNVNLGMDIGGRYRIDNEVNTIKLVINNGTKIYFNSKEAADKQINKLKAIVGEKIKNDLYKKAYIDLRFGDKIYYR